MRGHWRVIKCIGHKTGFLWNFRLHQTRKFAESTIKSETQMRILYINPSIVSIVIHIMHLLILTINSPNINLIFKMFTIILLIFWDHTYSYITIENIQLSKSIYWMPSAIFNKSQNKSKSISYDYILYFFPLAQWMRRYH